MSDKAFVVDTTKCQGCRGCQVACKQWNGLPAEKTEFFAGPELTNPANLSATTWNHVKFFPIDRSNEERPIWTIMHKKCYHCEEANCLRVCPEKAISKVDGWTIIDQSKCIGCGACTNECVYNVPYVSDISHTNDVGVTIVSRDKSHKCNVCMVNERDIPACVQTCPSGALLYGERQDMISYAQKRLVELQKDFPKASIYGLEEFGGLRVITVLRDKPEKYDLPTEVKAIDITAHDGIKDAYATLSSLSMGVPSLKRMAYRVAKNIGRA